MDRDIRAAVYEELVSDPRIDADGIVVDIFGGGTLDTVAHNAGQEDIAFTAGRPDAIRHGAIRPERFVHQLRQGRVVHVVIGRQCDRQQILHRGRASHPPRHRGRLRALGLARHRAVEGYVAVEDLDHDVVRLMSG